MLKHDCVLVFIHEFRSYSHGWLNHRPLWFRKGFFSTLRKFSFGYYSDYLILRECKRNYYTKC